MHASLLSASLLAAPALVAAGGTFGFALGNQNADGSCKKQADFDADLKAIAAASSAKIVRTYAASDCNGTEYLLPAAKDNGFQVVLGIWYVHFY
jgi:glucan 1,3-beta-glucosidase